MRSKKILILGDSHTVSLKMALAARARAEAKAIEFEIRWLMRTNGESKRGDLEFDEALKKAAALAPSDLIVLSILGTAHNLFGLLQHEQPFDFVFAPGDELALPDGVSLIPRGAVWNLLENFMTQNKSVRRIRDAAPCRVHHLYTPPPKQDGDYIAQRAKFYRGLSVSKIGISSADLRLKLWRVEMDILCALCEAWNISPVAAPEEAFSPQGFLDRKYYGDDATHANVAYGELVLRKVERLQKRTVQENA
jgi:hypothetical protein